MENIKKQVVLLLSDKDSPVISLQYVILKEALEKYADILIAFHQKETLIPSIIETSNHYLFTNTVLNELKFNPIGNTLVPGNNHFPLLKFYMENPGYEYYWVIEDDVRFSGKWTLLFDAFLTIPSDFITCCIRYWAKEPDWYWWWSLTHPIKNIPLDKRIASFNPVYRISNGALRFIFEALLDGWCGHHEVLLPTLLRYEGYSITDFGGDGDFVLHNNKNKFYISSRPGTDEDTMRFAPALKKTGDLPDKLYHPVKDFYPDSNSISMDHKR
jgi:hypothetical protein